MYCPKCGARAEYNFCHLCGTDMRAVRAALHAQDAKKLPREPLRTGDMAYAAYYPQKLEAIKALRSVEAIGLKEAKLRIDAVFECEAHARGICTAQPVKPQRQQEKKTAKPKCGRIESIPKYKDVEPTPKYENAEPTPKYENAEPTPKRERRELNPQQRRKILTMILLPIFTVVYLVSTVLVGLLRDYGAFGRRRR